MKLAINPKLMLAGILGLGLVSFSEKANPGYGSLGFWIVILGFSIFTVCMTLQHGKGESYRVRKGIHWGIATVRIVIVALLSLAIFRDVNFNMALLALNQLFLFGAIFDPALNHYDDRHFFYHGGQSLYDRIVRDHAELIFATEVAAYAATGLYLILTV